MMFGMSWASSIREWSEQKEDCFASLCSWPSHLPFLCPQTPDLLAENYVHTQLSFSLKPPVYASSRHSTYYLQVSEPIPAIWVVCSQSQATDTLQSFKELELGSEGLHGSVGWLWRFWSRRLSSCWPGGPIYLDLKRQLTEFPATPSPHPYLLGRQTQANEMDQLHLVLGPWITGESGNDYVINHLKLDHGILASSSDVNLKGCGLAMEWDSKASIPFQLIRTYLPVQLADGGGEREWVWRGDRQILHRGQECQGLDLKNLSLNKVL